GRAILHRTFIQYVGINIEAYESSTPMRKMKSGDAGVKNSILTPGGDKKRRHHWIEILSGEIKIHIEVLSVLWGNRLLIPDGSLSLSRLLKDHRT
nr:hypothetical protein [Tanacetum cinerariifolium]